MAICPECNTTDKPFFARRCHSCNQEIGFWRQTFAMYLFYGTVFIGFWFIVHSLFTATIQWWILGIFAAYVAIPLAIIWLIVFLYFYFFG